MGIFSELDQQVTALRGLLGEDADAIELASAMSSLDDDDIVTAIR